MKVKYVKSKGTRVKRYGYGVEVEGMWWNSATRRFTALIDTYKDGVVSNIAYPCRTLRAFKRFIKRHGYALDTPGVRIVWVNRKVNCDAWVGGVGRLGSQRWRLLDSPI